MFLGITKTQRKHHVESLFKNCLRSHVTSGVTFSFVSWTSRSLLLTLLNLKLLSLILSDRYQETQCGVPCVIKPTVVEQIRNGWSLRQHNTLVEPAVTGTFSQNCSPHVFRYLNLNPASDLAPQVDVTMHHSQIQAAALPAAIHQMTNRKLTNHHQTIPQKDTEVPTFEAIYARHRRVIHAMLLSEGDNSSTKAPDWHGRFWPAARGSGMNGSETQFKDEWANCTAFCQHLACRKCGQRLIWPEPGEKTFSSAWRQGFSIDFCSILFVFIPTFFLLCRFTCLKHNWVYSLLKLPCSSISGRSMNRNKARCIFFSCHAALKVR